jgi:2-dehydropantoate 2-reductase
MAAMWQKWAFIASMGALNCLLGGSVGEIAAVDGGDEAARAIVEETRAITGAAGYPLSDGALRQITGMLTARGSSFTSSLYRDLREGKPVEVETILGDLVAEGGKHDVRTPLLEAATVALRVHNAAVSGR